MIRIIIALALLLAASSAQAQQCMPGSHIGDCLCANNGNYVCNPPAEQQYEAVIPYFGGMTCDINKETSKITCSPSYQTDNAAKADWYRSCLANLKCWAWLRP